MGMGWPLREVRYEIRYCTGSWLVPGIRSRADCSAGFEAQSIMTILAIGNRAVRVQTDVERRL